MPKFSMSYEDLVEKSRNSFDAEDARMYADAAGSSPSAIEGREIELNPDEIGLDDTDFV